ncbi:MAG: HIT family protein [Burkholderiales bacterium]|nr:HIT family protein [Burkholderiales bacterium]
MEKLAVPSCELCESPGGQVLWRNALARVVAVEDADYPGFCRVILNRHVAEMTDLAEADRHALVAIVFAVEAALRALLAPDKMNLASLGNVVPHLHWHVIPRFRDDRHFPAPVWAAPARAASPRRAVAPQALADALAARLGPAAPA